jgi:hypothetical protein
VAASKSQAHLIDDYYRHRGKLRCRSVERYDASAQETIVLGVRFTYIDPITDEPHIGYFHRDTSRLTCTDLDGFIVTHFLTAEDYVVGLERSTYRD